jgi:ferrochelatase
MSSHALLLVNLGSPASTEVADVRRYLNQFLMDPYVIDIPWPLRRLLVALILLRRPVQSAHAYASIWWPEGSPLIVLSRRLLDAMRQQWHHGPVELAMRYGEPSLDRVLTRLAVQGIENVTLAPLYPQFADSTTSTVIKQAYTVITERKLPMRLNILPPFFDQPDYLDALAESARPYLEQDFDHLLLSFHGLPERHIRKLLKNIAPTHDLRRSDSLGLSDAVLARCYRSQCQRTAEAFAARMQLRPEQWSVSFQSRLGRDKWIEPYTEARLDQLAGQGVRKLLVMCPAFVSDCIETLEEIGDRGRAQFLNAGGQSLQLIPCLNDQPHWVAALKRLCERATPR